MLEKCCPVIIIGMHRSGTSLFARILHQCGVFMGARRNSHDEASFFLSRNYWLFNMAHAAWDNGEPVKYLLRFQELRSAAVARLRKDLASPKLRDYLGWAKYLKNRFLVNLNYPWGWKDPRNSYTLPLWLDIFPCAKVVHIIRNAPDVAGSLWRREHLRRNRLQNLLVSCRCYELEDAFLLWTEYVATCTAMIGDLPDSQVIQIRYEDFLAEPRKWLEKVAYFLQVRFHPTTMSKAVADIRPSHAYRFVKDETLFSLYNKQRNHALMKKFGYDNII